MTWQRGFLENLYFNKMPKKLKKKLAPELGFLDFQENELINFVWKCYESSFGSTETTYLLKFQFLIYGQKWSWSIRFEYSLILKIRGMD